MIQVKERARTSAISSQIRPVKGRKQVQAPAPTHVPSLLQGFGEQAVTCSLVGSLVGVIVGLAEGAAVVGSAEVGKSVGAAVWVPVGLLVGASASTQ